jgi:hypothetical protein
MNNYEGVCSFGVMPALLHFPNIGMDIRNQNEYRPSAVAGILA